MEFEGKRAVITGASSGIGREFAVQLHQKGCSLLLVARREKRLLELKEFFTQQRPGSAEVYSCDLSVQHDIKVLAEKLQGERIDILINNAGRGSFGKFDELSIDEEVGMIVLNTIAPVLLLHAVLPQMKARKEGAIVILSSIAGYQPLPYMSTYAATKAFDLFHSLGVHYELKEFGVRVLAVCPGPVATEFGGVARVPGTVAGGSRDSAQQVVSESIRALLKDKSVVFPGLRGKFLGMLVRVIPSFFSTQIVAKALKEVLGKSRNLTTIV